MRFAFTTLMVICTLYSYVYAQSFVFATLDGSPNMDTNGWTLVGSSATGDTPGDGDSDPDEMILTQAANSQASACYFSTPIDIGICDRWTVEFDYRIFGGNGADGIAFWFLANPPTAAINGGGLGISTAPQGLIVGLDPYQNCGGVTNPELQIRYGDGINNYIECPATAQPTLGALALIRQNNYNRMTVTYDNGNVEVFINGTSYLTGFYLTNYTGFLGFSASTGALNDQHSIKNVVISTSKPIALANAGGDQTICSGETVQLGQTPEPNVNYSWSPTTGLSNPNIANPTFTGTNAGVTPVVETFTLTATNASAPACFSTDVVAITIDPGAVNPNGCDLDSIRNVLTAAGCIEISGCNPGCSMYFFNPQSLTGNQAQAFAETFGANLVSIQSAAENQEIVNDLNALGVGGVIWIGYNDIATEGSFVWYDQSPISYTNWNPGEPNNLIPSCCNVPVFGCQSTQPRCNGGEDCTQLFPNGLWNDLPCDGGNDGSVIEIALCPQTTTSPDVTICNGASSTICASTILGSEPYSYEWPDGSTMSCISVSPSITTTYTVTVTGRYGCTSTDDVMVTVFDVPADAGADVAICEGDTTQLQGSGGDTYSWTPTTGLSDPNIDNPTASPAVTTNYVLTVQQVQGTLITNGDFSSGNVGFTSDYNFYTGAPNMGEGNYVVLPNPSPIHSGFTGADHTSGSGNFMIVNGSGSANQNVWCQTISVNPNTNYQFSTWVSSIALGSPALLQFSANGTLLGPVFSAPGSLNNWQQFFATWNSGANSSVTICIVNQNTTLGGNDFGLDDISFSEVCSGTDTVMVTVNPLPNIDAGLDSSICAGGSLQLLATGGVSYVWSPSTDLSATTIADPVSTPAANIRYYVDGTDANNCTIRDSVLITVDALPVVSFTGLNPTYCIDDSTSALIGTPSLGVFSGTGVVATDFNPVAAGVGPTAITYVFTDANGCVDSVINSTTVNELPVLGISGLDTGYCEDASPVTVTVDPAGGVLYGTGVSGNQFEPALAGVGSDSVYYTFTDANGCSDTIASYVSVFELPEGQLFAQDAICFDSTNGLAFVIANNGTLPYTYSWGGILGDTLTNLGAGMYDVLVTDANGCTFMGSTLVNEPAPLVVDLFADRDSAFLGQEVNLWFEHNSPGDLTRTWGPSDGFLMPIAGTDSATTEMLETVMYSIEIRDTNNCPAGDSLTIYLKPEKIRYLPNVFTPNGDGLNDVFEIQALGLQDYRMQIFNRAGSKIFESREPSEGWDGTFNGKKCLPGVYVYQVTLTYYDKELERLYGSVTLIR